MQINILQYTGQSPTTKNYPPKCRCCQDWETQHSIKQYPIDDWVKVTGADRKKERKKGKEMRQTVIRGYDHLQVILGEPGSTSQ